MTRKKDVKGALKRIADLEIVEADGFDPSTIPIEKKNERQKLQLEGDNRAVTPVTGHEIIVTCPDEDDTDILEKDCGIISQCKKPNAVNAAACKDRLDLADNANCLIMATDAAEGIKNANPLEKMLVHQMAAMHKISMELAKQITENLASQTKESVSARTSKNQKTSILHPVDIQAKRINSFVKATAAYQKGMDVLARFKRGGKQTVTVQHVKVDGQAVVANKMDCTPRGDSSGGEQEN